MSPSASPRTISKPQNEPQPHGTTRLLPQTGQRVHEDRANRIGSSQITSKHRESRKSDLGNPTRFNQNIRRLSYGFLCRSGENEPPREGLHPFRGGEGGIASRLAVGRAELELDHPRLFPKACTDTRAVYSR